MAQSTLIVYDSIESAPADERLYWQSYIDFYEQYWGGPMSPFGIWFGNEYENFRKAIAEFLSVEKDAVRDCFFIRSEEGLFVCPLSAGENRNILSCENAVPLEWFAAFEESGRRNFYSHWGFSSIHYNTRVGDARERLAAASGAISRALEEVGSGGSAAAIERLDGGVRTMSDWFSGRDGGGYAVLNYGDVCSVLNPQSLDRERSVEQLSEALSLLGGGERERACEILSRLERKWDDLREMCAAAAGQKPLQ
ncbi:MAG: hypothetical protein OXF52_02650 [Candidatus Dadabacteria bacterium]|nr:hypothetical protein [Candidatus Dadabacteria bacterium]